MYSNPNGNGSGSASRIPKPSASSSSGSHNSGGMSPSTIGSSPRPYSQSPRVLSSGSGSGSSNSHSYSHTSSPSPTSPRPDTPQYRTGNQTAQHPHSQISQQHRSTPNGDGGNGNGIGTAPLTVSGRRRPGGEDSPSTPIAIPGGRRGIPHPAPGSLLMPSPEISGLPRLSSLNHGSRTGQSPHSASNSNPNSTLSPPPTPAPAAHRNSPRQVSTPTLGPNTIPRKPVTDPMPSRQRPRSQSAMSPSTPSAHAPPSDPVQAPDTDTTPDATSASTKPQAQAQALTPVLGMADRVPLHIRVRLRLIHQLGTVLGLDAQGIASKIDIPGLLARVDAAYDRGHADLGLGLPMESTPSGGGTGSTGERKGGVMSVLKRMGGGGKVKSPPDEFGGYSPKVTVEGEHVPAE